MSNQPIEEKVKEWLSQGVAREWPEVVAFIENLLEQERKRISEEIEKLKRYDIEEDDGACGDPECCGLASYMIEETGDGEYLGRDDVLKILKH